MRYEDMELRDLRYFIAVAEELHFGHAATRLSITQPSLSKAIQRLENQLGVRLFYRSKRKVELTSAGSTFLEGARRIVAEAGSASRMAHLAGSGQVGSLRVGFVSSATFTILPALLREFRQIYPLVVLEFHELTTSAQMHAFRSGHIDVGLVRPPVWEESLEQRIIFDERLIIALPPNHPLSKDRDVLDLKSLAFEPFVLFSRDITPGFYDALIGSCHDAGFDPRIVHECNSFVSAIALVAGGVGVSLIPRSMAPQLERLGGVVKEIEEDVSVEWAAVWPTGLDEMRPHLQGFLAATERLPRGEA